MSNTIEIKVPDIGDFSDIPVIELLVAPGDTIDVDDGLVTLESDKATMEVPSPVAGVVRELRVGLDDTVSEGDVVAVHYKGTLSNGAEFDNSHKRGEPIRFPLGVGAVIAGWDEGIGLMAEGGRATLTIPPELGYGAAGAGGVIPPNATLVFEVELLAVQ